jgi:rare lipoprotein A (peptidoglycan hydrolase)
VPLATILLVRRGELAAVLLVNDRGPYVPGRVLDLSHAAAVHLGVGVSPVEAEVLVPAR